MLLYFLFISNPKTNLEEKGEEPIPSRLPKSVTTKKEQVKIIEKKEINRPFIGADFNPIEPPTQGLPMVNMVNANFDSILTSQFKNPDIPEGSTEVNHLGSFIMVKNGFGRYVEKISVIVTSPNSSPHSFEAIADSNTGEILQIFNDSEGNKFEEQENPESTPFPEGYSE